MVKFDEVLQIDDKGHVTASGPVDSSKEKIVDLCAWVFQREGETDAAVTEMTHQHNGAHHGLIGEGELKVEGNHWSLELAQIGNEGMSLGRDAFAVAVAMIEDKNSGKQQVIWWGHPVKLGREASRSDSSV
jgi:hypothetical protein